MLTLSQTMQTAMAAGNPQRVLLEFYDPTTHQVSETFSNEEIAITRGVEWSAAFNGEEELTMGLCPSAQISFTLLNDNRTLNGFEFGEFSAWIGYRLAPGTTPAGTKYETFEGDGLYEFAPLGVFIAERPDIVAKDMIEVRASDRMTLFDVEMPSKTDLSLNPTSSNPVRILDLLQAMCGYVGVSLANTQAGGWFMNYDLTFTSWPTKYFSGKTMREVLKYIAEAAGSIARFNRDGDLEICWFTTVNVTYDEGDYKEFAQTWYETATIDGLKVRNADETSETSYGTNPTNYYVIAGNPFLK